MKLVFKILSTLYFLNLLNSKILGSPRARNLQVTLDQGSPQDLSNQQTSNDDRNLFTPAMPYGLNPGMGLGLGMSAMSLGGMGGMNPSMMGAGSFMNNQSGIMHSPSSLGTVSTDRIDTDNLSNSERRDFNHATEQLGDPKNDINMQIPGADNWENDSTSGECNDIKQEATDIANIITRRQNKIIYDEIMKYVLKSKYLLGVTEINMTKALREKVLNIMERFSNIEDKHFNEISPTEDIIGNKNTRESDNDYNSEESNQEVDTEEENSMTDAGPEISDVLKND